MIYAAIVAGGTGSRMGADMPKQFLKLGDRPVLIHTLIRFLGCGEIDHIYVGVHKDWTERLHEMCVEARLDTERISILEGGADRDSTVRRIIDRIYSEHEVKSGDIIITHDGVRPFVSKKEISDSIASMQSDDGASICLPSTDTLLHSTDGSFVCDVPDRSQLFRALTPQTFRLERLTEAYRSLSAEQCAAITDTASVFMLAGLKVRLIVGSTHNIKLTTPDDMKIGELFLKEEAEDE